VRLAALVLVLAAAQVPAQQESDKITVRVDAASNMGPFRPLWAFFGYDEPNYTYAPNGRKLLGELATLSPAPVYIRAHNLLTSGDGMPALKWGSTNVYTKAAAGGPMYDWTIMDRIFDTWHAAKLRPLVEIGFMPEALSTHPEPYRHTWPKGSLATGWAHPPNDYQAWAELIFKWVRHEVERYGEDEVASWYWEVWNEPDGAYWLASPEEYYKLYDFTADAVKRALPAARIGGPHSTGPAGEKAAAFLRAFLEHAIRGTNYATGKTGAPLDYIGFHAKGSPHLVDGRVQMGIRKQLQDVAHGFEIVASFPELRNKPVIIGESDPEGCAACSAKTNPQNAYRNGALYPCYTAAALHGILDLAEAHAINLAGVVTWAFEFEDQPWFEGFRSLATNGVDKPVLNLFRMLGMMTGQRLRTESAGAVGIESMLGDGVRGRPDIGAMASRGERAISVLLWNYHDDDLPAPDADIKLELAGLPGGHVEVRHNRIDATHSNAYTVWKQLGSPQSPSPEQLARLASAAQLERLEPPRRLPGNGPVIVEFRLPRQAVSLVQLVW
jgi:xylan 1,4-beta-xylosidase